LFVGGFPAATPDDEIRQIVEQYGRVRDLRIIPSKRPGGLTCAFVTYDNRKSCNDAINYINGFAYGSHVLTCRWRDAGAAESPRYEQPSRAPPSRGSDARRDADSRFPSRGGGAKIFVGKIGAHIDGEAVKSCFSRFGQINQVIEPPAKGPIKVMFLTYDSVDAARRAVEVMNEQPLFPGEAPLRVKFE
jgi:RNA recognition motif-containing protein